MIQYSILLSGIYGNTEMFSTDSVLAKAVELENIPIAVRYEANNWGFILFFICFFIIVNVISDRNKFLPSMFSRLYRNKDRQSMFYETVTNESLNIVTLNLQTVLLLSIVFYCYAIHEQFYSPATQTEMYLFIGKIFLMLIAYFFYKFLTYSIAGLIFFKRETLLQWNDDFFSLISLNGIIIFFPTLILFYVEEFYTFGIYFLIFFLIFNLFFVAYKIYVLFFQRNQRLLYFILYLCTQEIIPLYLLYRGLLYLIVQKDTIWM